MDGMHSLNITVKACTEWHEPKDYEFFSALQIDVYEMSGGNPNVEKLVIHRCEDIIGLASSTDKDVALVAAREWLAGNYKSPIQALISDFGE